MFLHFPAALSYFCDFVHSFFTDDVSHLGDDERGHTGSKQWAQASETLHNTDSEPNYQAAVDEVSAEAGSLDVN